MEMKPTDVCTARELLLFYHPIQTLESQTGSNFHFWKAGNESWIFYEYRHDTVSVLSWEEAEEPERPTHCHRKTIVISFSNGKAIAIRFTQEM
jgi:hypothetical protein